MSDAFSVMRITLQPIGSDYGKIGAETQEVKRQKATNTSCLV
jgi:hypothetical protein